MGNSESKSDHEHGTDEKDPLRDYSVVVNLPSSISKPTSNLLLGYIEGHYFPCIILNRAKHITNGYLVYFLHNQIETEIPSCNVIGNFKALLNCTVSFSVDGRQCCGKVYDISMNEKNEATNFFVSCLDQCAWISLPFIYLTIAQARQLSS